MYSIIAIGRDDDYNNTPFFRFSYVYKHFLENLQKLSYEECETEVDQNVAELLRPHHTSPWEEAHETESNGNYEYRHRDGTPYADREIQNAFSGRRGRSKGKGRGRRRGHNWTRRKNSRSKSRLTTCSEPVPRRSREQLSVMNYSEYYNSDRSDSDHDNDEDVPSNLANAVRYQNGILQTKRTRSVGRKQDDQVLTQVATRYKCIDDCPFEFDDLSELTEHKIEEHRMLAKYICYECFSTRFVSPEDLRLHNDLYHHTLISNCLLCSVELRTVEELQKHLEEHKLHSFPCNYCDMFFLNRNSCRAHIDQCHKGKKKRIKKFRPHTIIDRIYRSDNMTPVNVLESNIEYDGKIIWRPQKGSNVDDLSTLCTDIKSACTSVTSSVEDTNLLREVSNSINSFDIESEVNVIENHNDNLTISSHDENEKMTQINSDKMPESPEIVLNVANETDVYTSEEIDSNSTKEKSNEIIISNAVNGSTNSFLSITNENFENFVNTNTAGDLFDNNGPEPESVDNKINNKLLYQNEISNKHKNLKTNGPLINCSNSEVEES